MTREEKVDLLAGAASEPENLRQVARKANQAGREGWELVDAEVGMDREAYLERHEMRAIVRLLYRRVEA